MAHTPSVAATSAQCYRHLADSHVLGHLQLSALSISQTQGDDRCTLLGRERALYYWRNHVNSRMASRIWLADD
ncbi:hypothetical protein [Chromobacterium sp. IRSSSOUMB001]|uniref:hypothetical protein n=1 Tax=Chromobacterium sp. IRSSSOUMB001 TaxID=2927123 RepID=UPI0020C064F1|nr:hypothetical protein [Chromobacterium sp. IRSSSOUMB001]